MSKSEYVFGGIPTGAPVYLASVSCLVEQLPPIMLSERSIGGGNAKTTSCSISKEGRDVNGKP